MIRKVIRRIAYSGPVTRFRRWVAPRRVKYFWVEKIAFTQLGTTVLEGSFTGMQMVVSSTANAILRLLGMYEHALNDTIETVIEKNYTEIFNIGSAEGYYAVGLALRLPNAKVFAYELDATRAQHCRNAALINHVDDRFTVKSECTFEEFEGNIGEKSFIFMDCEGCELALLDSEHAPSLKKADILVEVHDFINPIIGSTLKERFADSHKLTIVEDLPSIETHPRLDFLTRAQQKLILAEMRPNGMYWFYFQAV